jgi:hypothetical protein
MSGVVRLRVAGDALLCGWRHLVDAMAVLRRLALGGWPVHVSDC